MYITNNYNQGKSELFVTSARLALKHVIENSHIKEKRSLANFVVKEATDYEVMHLLVRESLPDKQFNDIDEFVLFATLKEQILNNIDTLSESFDVNMLKDVLTEVDSPYANRNLLSEQESGFDKITRGLKKTAKETKKGLGEVKDKVIPGNPFKKYLDKRSAEKATRAKEKATALRAPDVDRETEYTSSVEKATRAKDVKDKATAKKAALRAPDVDREDDNRAIGATTTPAMIDRIKSAAKTGKEAVVKTLSNKNVQMAIGGAALAALAIYGAAKTYKRFFSPAAKACSSLSGFQKTACMDKYRVQALAKQIEDLNGSMVGCSKVKNPEKCKAAIQSRVEKLKKKIQKAKTRG